MWKPACALVLALVASPAWAFDIYSLGDQAYGAYDKLDALQSFDPTGGSFQADQLQHQVEPTGRSDWVFTPSDQSNRAYNEMLVAPRPFDPTGGSFQADEVQRQIDAASEEQQREDANRPLFGPYS